MATAQIKKPVKIIKLEGNKKLTLVNAENLNATHQTKHQKANTQNINIFNVIHNESRPPNADHYTNYKISENITINGRHNKLPSSNAKALHEMALRQELQLYKAEVERRFNGSLVNKSYVFPRKINEVVESTEGLFNDIKVNDKEQKSKAYNLIDRRSNNCFYIFTE